MKGLVDPIAYAWRLSNRLALPSSLARSAAVTARVRKASEDRKAPPPYSPEEIATVRHSYATHRNAGTLAELAALLRRSVKSINMLAHRLGLCDARAGQRARVERERAK